MNKHILLLTLASLKILTLSALAAQSSALPLNKNLPTTVSLETPLNTPVNTGELVPNPPSIKRSLLDKDLGIAPLASWVHTPSLPSLNTLPLRLDILDAQGSLLFREIEIAPKLRILAQEWLVWHSASAVLSEQQGVTVLERASLDALGIVSTRLRVNSTLDNASTVKSLWQGEVYELQRNFVYLAQTTSASPASKPASPPDDSKQALEQQLKAPQCADTLKVGMIDTAIDTQHPQFENTQLQTHSVVDSGAVEPLAHGTAVASRFYSVLPTAHLYHASAFYRRNNYSEGASTQALLKALNYLAESNVEIINLSLAGPEDPLVRLAIQTLREKGIIFVAAVGNEGPASAPLYPAAYPNVIGVTAIDEADRIYRWALQGNQVDVSARGVQVSVARPGGGYAPESGTSLAAPLVSAWLACALSERKPSLSQFDLKLFEAQLIDLGRQGKDSVFGFGKLEFP